jgi:hypothetical protein
MAAKKRRTKKIVKKTTPKTTGKKTAKTQAKPKRGRKLGSKTLFILAQPSEVPAADVVATAAQRGLQITSALVYKVRSKYRGKAVSKTAAITPLPEAALVAAPGKHKNASAFVRAQPLEKPAKQVVTEAKKAGFAVKPNLVYMVRSSMKKKGVVAKSGPKPKDARSGLKVATGTSSTEATFKEAALEVGLANARRLLTELEAGVRSLIGR